MTLEERGDLAESLVPVAGELAFLVRTEGRDAIGAWLDRHGLAEGAAVTPEVRALLVVLAARVDIDATDEDQLSWVTFDEHGQPLDGTIPLLPVVAVPAPRIVSRTARIEDYAGLRASGVTVSDAARQLQMPRRTATTWERKLRDEGRAPWRQAEGADAAA
jgi:hypothetical protein